jgi:hypothetical protein
MKCEWRGLFEHLVARIWPADPHENVIFTGQIGSYMTLTFTSILSPNQDVYELRIAAPV